MTDPAVINELKRLSDESDGVLTAEVVVDAAREESSVLHSQFEWDDSQAAEQYRLWQARRLLNVTVEYIGPKNARVRTRVFVSLTPDRKNESGGYRQIQAVLSDKVQRGQLLKDAQAEMVRFEEKYKTLTELAEVFAAMRRARRMAA